MPIYEYRCQLCKDLFERYLPIQQCAEPQLCLCGGTGVKQFSIPSFGGSTYLPQRVKEQLRIPFGHSVDAMNTYGDLTKHIDQKSKEFGIHINPLES